MFEVANCDIKRRHKALMAKRTATTSRDGMDARIHSVRDQRVMLDSDLAMIYGVSTSALNQALKRNLKRFPIDFAFQLTTGEFAALMSQIVISKNGRGGRRKLPWVFTEHGAIMVATILNSPRATEMSVFVVRAFVQMRETFLVNRQLAAKLDELEKRVGSHDDVIADLINAIRPLLEPPVEEKPRREIGFHLRETSPRYRISRTR
jgi:hypothetical protein